MFSDEEIFDILKLSQLEYMVNNQKDGINLKINENGSNLSSGEK